MNKSQRQAVWTLDLLNTIEWRRFEELCTRLFEHKGFTCKAQSHGADEGIDINLYFGKETLTLDRIVQCKAWKKKVGVEPMRAFYGTMISAGAKRGTFVSRGGLTDDAAAFAVKNGIHTIDGQQLLELITKLDPTESRILLERITEGDYSTPTCASCGIKLVARSVDTDKPFWGCKNWKPYGKGCNTKMHMTNEHLAALKSSATLAAEKKSTVAIGIEWGKSAVSRRNEEN
jgi:restriction system protein